MRKRQYYITTIEIIEAKNEMEASKIAKKNSDKRNMPFCKLKINPVLEQINK